MGFFKDVGNGLKKVGKVVVDAHVEPIKFIHNNAVMPGIRMAADVHNALPHPQVSHGHPGHGHFGHPHAEQRQMNWVPYDPYTNTPAHFGIETQRQRGIREGYDMAQQDVMRNGSRFWGQPGAAQPIIIMNPPQVDPMAAAAMGQAPAAPPAPVETAEQHLYKLKVSAYEQAGYNHFQNGKSDLMIKDGKPFNLNASTNDMPPEVKANFDDLLKVDRGPGGQGAPGMANPFQALGGDAAPLMKVLATIFATPELREVLDNLINVARIKQDMKEHPAKAPKEDAPDKKAEATDKKPEAKKDEHEAKAGKPPVAAKKPGAGAPAVH